MRHLRAELREMVREQIDGRELLLQMTIRDLRLRYKHTLMGAAWAVFTPLLSTAIFAVIFTRVAPVETAIPYAAFAYCGLVAWNFTASSLRFAVASLTSNATLVTKVYFPREIFPFSSVLVSTVDSAVAATVLGVLMAYYRIPVTPAIFFVPVVVFVHISFTAAMGLLLAMANLFYRDVKYLFEVVLTLWMFATAVVYPLDQVTGRLGTLLLLNPLTPIIDAYRATILQGQLPAAAPFAYATAVSLAGLTLAWIGFHKAEFAFAENI